jgi:hypothetical protein
MSPQETITVNSKLEVEAARSDTALIGALKYLGTLRELDFSYVETDMQSPLNQLFEYAKTRMEVGGRDRDLPKKIDGFFPNQPHAPEWVSDTDLKHTVASFDYLTGITNKERFTHQDKKIVLSALLVHDCAYPRTKDFAAFTNSDTRLSHMKDGEAEFRIFANKINDKYSNFYSLGEIEIICSIVRQHDNPSIKLDGKTLQFNYNPPSQRLMWAHREADRLWMLDRGGFALDLIRRLLESEPSYNTTDYLQHVISGHMKEALKYENNDPCISFHGEKSLYRTQAGFEIFQKLVGERTKEYNINLTVPSEAN